MSNDIRERLKSYFERGDKPTQEQFAELIDNSIYSIENILYQDLVSLSDSSLFVPGQLYRITDYITTTTQANTQSAGHPFDIIVLALSESKLSEQAWAVKSARDSEDYFAGSKLSAWQIWYSLDNDTDRFAWADITNGKGVIYRMIDEHNNDCPYDFKNIKFRHPNDTKEYPSHYYTFGIVRPGVVSDHSFDGDYCYGNKISPRITGGKQELNNIVFINGSALILCHSNSFGDNCYSNSFDNHCYANTFGSNCYSNSFSYGCFCNTFGNDCYANSIGNNCQHNSFGNECYYNSLDYDCKYNSFGNHCYSNSLDYSCQANSFGNDCYSNSIGYSCKFNSLGNTCLSNSFGNDCYSNSFGNTCQHNSLGNTCHANSLGNTCKYNTLARECRYNSFGNSCQYNKMGDYYRYNRVDDGVSSVELYNTRTSSSNQQVQNYHLVRGLGSRTIEVERNRSYETTVAIDSSGNVKQFCIADLT